MVELTPFTWLSIELTPFRPIANILFFAHFEPVCVWQVCYHTNVFKDLTVSVLKVSSWRSDLVQCY